MSPTHLNTEDKRRNVVGDGGEAAPLMSPAVVYGDLVWTSGQLPTDAEGNTPDEFSEQVELTFDNLERTLHQAGASLATVLKVSIFLADINDLGTLNEVYRRRLGGSAPARTTVQVAAFRGTKRVELDVVAHLASGASPAGGSAG
ncbi:RidA family protein [Parasphingorhabdus pacifica]